MREYGQARRRDRKPQEIADNEAGDERRNAAEALAENARHDGGDARSRRRDGGRIDSDEQQQRRKRHGALPRPLLKGKPRPNPTYPSQSAPLFAIQASSDQSPGPKAASARNPPAIAMFFWKW